MNKILIENDVISFENEVIYGEIKTKDLTINIFKTVHLNLEDNNNLIKNLTINVERDSQLFLNYYNIEAHLSTNIDLNIEDKGQAIINMGLIGNGQNTLNIKTKMLKNNITNILNLRCISQDEGSFNICIDGHVLKNTYNNIMKESINLLNLNNRENKLIPNMLVSSSEVKADHFVAISNIREDELFYLTSKGISKDKAKELIKKGFIMSLYDQDMQEFISS